MTSYNDSYVTASSEVENVTSSNSTTSRDKEEFIAKIVENVIVRYVFPVVIIVGKYHTNHSL